MLVNNYKNLKWITAIFFLFLVKIIFGIYLANTNSNFFSTPDTITYLEPAKEICETGKFYNSDKTPATKSPPGVSIFLLPPVCFDFNINYYVIFLNSIMLLMSAFFTYKIIKLMRINISIFFIFLFFLLDPTLTRYHYSILSEIIFLFWFTLSLYFFIFGIKKNNYYFLFFGFILLTLATFIRPVTFFLPYLLFIFLIIVYLLNSSLKIKVKYFMIITSILGLSFHFALTQLWSNRNFHEAGIREFSTVKNINAYYYMTASIIAKAEKKDFTNVQKKFIKRSQNLSKKEFSEISKKAFKKALINYPFESIQVVIEGAIMTFIAPGTGQYYRLFNIEKVNIDRTNTIFIIYGLFWVMLMWGLAVYGLIKIKKNIIIYFLMLIFIYLSLVSSGPMSYSRFRIPFMPIITLLVSVGFINIMKKIDKLKS
jgi:hypothetical protein